MNESELLEKLLATDKADDVAALIKEYEEAHPEAKWRPVGDRPNNSGTIQAAGDPARALLERVTNAIDAVIERAHTSHKGKPTCDSPREAAQAWFGVPSAGFHKLSNAQARKIAEDSVQLQLLPGHGRSRRAVDISDSGNGLTVGQIPKTILSLNESNKVDKLYLSGAFGQGGSATFASSEYTLIASRSATGDGTIGFTVVRHQMPLPDKEKLGSYRYLVGADNEVLSTKDAPETYGAFSTHVRHYGYDLDDYNSPVGPSSLYGRSQAVLFEPVLPFMFDNRVHDYRRTIKGSRTALNGARQEAEGEEESKLSHSIPLFFSDLGEFGRIGIEYWVLEPSAKTAPNKAFVNGSKPVVLTVNGQTHAEWSATVIRKEAELTHLASRIVVHLDCNKLSFDAKRLLFVSNREESRKGMVQNAILEELIGALKSDEKLTELNEQAKSAGLKDRDEKTEKEVRQEVAKMFKVYGFSVSEGAGSTKDKEGKEPGGDKPPKPRPKPMPIPVREPPTFVELVGDEPLRFFPGQRRYLRIRTDAHSKYHDATDASRSSFQFLTDGKGLKVVGSTELREGHMRFIVLADPDIAVGTEGKLSVELRPQSARTLTAQLGYKIVEAPQAKPRASKISFPNIEYQVIEAKESEEWVNLGWPDDVAEVAADYEFAAGTITISYSTIFPSYKKMFDQLANKDVALAASFLKRYEIWLTTAVVIHWQDTAEDETPLHDAEVDSDKLSDYRRDEMRRMAKAAILFAHRDLAFTGETKLEEE